jgi:hypothetical protein
MVSRALHKGPLHHQSLSEEDGEWYAEPLHDAIEEAGSTFPAPSPGIVPHLRTLQSPTRQRKPRQKKLHDAVKKRRMTSAELAEKAAKQPKAQPAASTGQSQAAAPPTNAAGAGKLEQRVPKRASSVVAEVGRGRLVSVKPRSAEAVGNGGTNIQRAIKEVINCINDWLHRLNFYALFQTSNSTV